MLSAVRPGGVALLHVLNLWQLPDGPCVWQKCRRTTLPQGEGLIVKGVHRCGSRGYVEFLILDPAGGLLDSESIPFLGLEAAELENAATECGASRVSVFGGYQEQPYERAKSTDLVVVAYK